MSGDVVARARELLAAYEDGYPVNTCGKHTGRASNRCLLPAEHEGPHDDDPPPFTFPDTLVTELIEELEMQTSLQGLSVQIPEYGEWGSETLLYLFQDFGIQPGDGYQEASSRQGDLLRALAAANAEVEKLRGALETIRERCRDTGEFQALAKHLHAQSARLLAVDILDVIERAGIEP